jgi:thiamine-phosphate pyrophosphorylase
MKRVLPQKGLYVVVTSKFANGRRHEEILPALLKAGVKMIQLREKDMNDRELYKLARYYREETHEAEAILIINDRLDIAMAVDADGVHLGQNDLPFMIAGSLWKERIIGVSTHSLEEAVHVYGYYPGYINVGPIYPTQTKENPSQPVGIETFKKVLHSVEAPVTVMGGIKSSNLNELLEAGARRIGVITEVLSAPDIYIAARVLEARIQAYGT